LTIVVGITLALCVSTVRAEVMTEPYEYSQDFENTDPVSFWTSNGTYKENSKKLTGERAYAGAKSLELDVTFGTATYVYYAIPMNVPVEGSLSFSGRIQVRAENPKLQAGLGVNVSYLPTFRSGCAPLATYGPKADVWQVVEGDVAAWSNKQKAGGVGPCWEVTEANVGSCMSRIGLFLYGAPGERIVVNVDDVRLKGKVPTLTDFQKDLSSRWAPAKAKIDAKVAAWNASLTQAEARIGSLADGDEKTKSLHQIASLRKSIDAIAKRGYILKAEVSDMDKQINQLLATSPAASGN
ncbi:MAG: hypothetical protein PHT33_03055, partial [bacterium]|nr:hypothetical protein [bacterium]